jgi:hypothetical protein
VAVAITCRRRLRSSRMAWSLRRNFSPRSGRQTDPSHNIWRRCALSRSSRPENCRTSRAIVLSLSSPALEPPPFGVAVAIAFTATGPGRAGGGESQIRAAS